VPTVDVLFNDLQRLIGLKLPREIDDLNEILSSVKGEVESLEGDELSVEIKDGNRPDLWNVEGIARELMGALGIEEGLRGYAVKDYSGVEVTVDPRLRGIRPYIACSVVKAVSLDYEAIRGLMHLQDKLDLTYGRKRTRTSIGVYNYDLIKPPVRYGVANPTEISFVPLRDTRELSLRQILDTHPKGLEYGHILEEHKNWPILSDANGGILSLPPIINSNDLGRIEEGVRDIFVEVTGTVYQTVLNTIMIVTLSLADRGEDILSAKIHYPYEKVGMDETPRLKTRTMNLKTSYVDQILGLNLNVQHVVKLLKKARYDAHQVDEETVALTIPCYRIDVMHPVDVIEDIAIKYGYNNIEPQRPQFITFGRLSDAEVQSDLAREVMVGLGFQEVLSFSMSNKLKLFNKMNIEDGQVIEISNPMTLRYNCLRNWLMPSLIEFLSKNTSVECPQRLFEVGECVVPDKNSLTGVRDVIKLACLSIHPKASFSEIKSILDSFLRNMGVEYEVEEKAFKSFIDGRVGAILVDGEEIGFIGEVDPRVLEAWKLENPVVGFEIDLEKTLKRFAK
jgi:phenylalanyl-tRNA synthetase beta chain